MLILLLTYTSLLFFLLPSTSFSASPSSSIVLHATHALSWCLFHSFGLGTVLRAQSEGKFLVRHYLKHYHYPTSGAGRTGKYGVGRYGEGKEGRHGRDDGAGEGAVREAFMNWKVVYNLSMCMTYGAFCLFFFLFEFEFSFELRCWKERKADSFVMGWVGMDTNSEFLGTGVEHV